MGKLITEVSIERKEYSFSIKFTEEENPKEIIDDPFYDDIEDIEVMEKK